VGWQTAFVIFGLPSLIMGLTLFLVRDQAAAAEANASGTKKAKAGFDAYVQCLKNRNILFTSLVLMVGAAGPGAGGHLTYLVLFFMKTFDVPASAGGMLLTLMQVGGLVGPLFIAWFSDRLGKRRGVTQATLFLSAVTTVYLVQHHSLSILFYINLLLYGAFV